MPNFSALRIHILYEGEHGASPDGCSVIRLLRPLMHPTVSDFVTLTYSADIPKHPVDVVIIERLWIQQLTMLDTLQALNSLKQRGIRIIYETDDNLLNADTCAGDTAWPSPQQKNIIRLLAREAHGVIVSTPTLAKTFATLNGNVHIFNSMLDESLFQRQINTTQNKKIKFGYMGTHTHLADLMFVSTALKHVLHKHKDNVEFEIVGVGDTHTIRALFGKAPVTIKNVPYPNKPYEKFCAWMSENLKWDFGIAPLLRSDFSDSKSDIKFLDYSIMGIPGIYSNVPAYADTVKHNATGLLCDNTVEQWTQHLEAMITSASLRFSLAEAAYDYVRHHRVLQHRAVDLLKIIQAVAAA